MTVGTVVRSLRGRDKKRPYMIVGVAEDGERVLLADGQLHKITSPKEKNLRHIAVLAIADGDETSIPGEDSELRNFLRKFEENQNAEY